MDLKQYRLDTDWSWYEIYKNRYGSDAFNHYREKVHYVLALLKPGRNYDLKESVDKGSRIFIIEYEKSGIRKEESNPDLFIKLCCSYIQTVGGYSFSEDFTKIKRDL